MDSVGFALVVLDLEAFAERRPAAHALLMSMTLALVLSGQGRALHAMTLL